MSHKLINHSPDLKKLQNEGFEVEIEGGFLLINNIPYLNSGKTVMRGILVSKLTLAGEITTRPEDHVVYFVGEFPCDSDGNNILALGDPNQAQQNLTEEITINFSFSSKPSDGYKDYYEKMTTYVKILSGPAQSIDSSVNANTFNLVESQEEDSVFNYFDTNSSRAEIDTISAKLKNIKVAVIGLGGTGSYVLDLITKTPVKEIHIFDGDEFLQHNAFRAPGAASIEELKQKSKKVVYLKEKYSKMHKYIISHDYHINETNLDELIGMDYVFICMDGGEIKKLIVEKLKTNGISFIDTGVGIEDVDERLVGSVRTTISSRNKNDHIDNRIPFSDGGNEDYVQNIQIADLNMLNAALAVIKWKKMCGFYDDKENEFHSVYNININNIINDENLS